MSSPDQLKKKKPKKKHDRKETENSLLGRNSALVGGKKESFGKMTGGTSTDIRCLQRGWVIGRENGRRRSACERPKEGHRGKKKKEK